jgi:hypothetical protein
MYDDAHEFLKRPYLIAESIPKIQNMVEYMVEFYQKHSVVQPNLSMLDQGKNMIKLRDKIYYLRKKLYKAKDSKGSNKPNLLKIEEK